MHVSPTFILNIKLIFTFEIIIHINKHIYANIVYIIVLYVLFTLWNGK